VACEAYIWAVGGAVPVVSLRSAYFPELDVAHSVKPVINRYDEYGVPPAGFSGRFGYAGSMYLNCAMAAPWNMRNRQYNPTLGRFMQTDPIGIAGGVNLYAYVGGDPVNAVDPWGLQEDYAGRTRYTCGQALRPGQCTTAGICRGGGGTVVKANGGIWCVIDTFGGIGGMAWGGGNRFAFGGGGKAGAQSQRCFADPRYAPFFSQQGQYARFVGNILNVDPTLLLGLSAWESGYGSSRQYREQSNPFGATPLGGRSRGLTYRNFNDAWVDWGRDWGSRVFGVGSNAELFVDRLLIDNRGGGGTDNRGAYNSLVAPAGDPNWPAGVLGTIAGVRGRYPQWQSNGC
jgi:RHS repeat-associated protein